MPRRPSLVPRHLAAVALLTIAQLAVSFRACRAEERLRVIVETDAGGDPDDEQSLVRFLLYTNEWDVEGIIANRPVAREGENRNRERTGPGIVRGLVNAYGECHARLVRHDSRYPGVETLLERTVAGYDEVEDGVDLVLRAVDADDPRPLWFLNWGTDRGSGRSCLARALDRVLETRGEEGYARFKSRLRLSSYDAFGEHTRRDPPFPLWVDTFRPERDGKRWYHRFSELTRTAGGFDIERDCRSGHGPLGALYPLNTTHRQKEGDTMCFLYLAPVGVGDPEEPGWGSWAGRYSRRPEFGTRSYFHADAPDTWEGVTHRDQSLARFAAALQNDFRARLDWCVSDPAEANHPPVVRVGDCGGTSVIWLRPRVGERLELDASASSDPDGDELSFVWFVYGEADSYDGTVEIERARDASARIQVPGDAAGTTIHLVVAVTDAGAPPLTRYRRVVLAPRDPERAWKELAPMFRPPEIEPEAAARYPSPLRFADGRIARDAGDWGSRREELLAAWRKELGAWPEEIPSSRLEVLEERTRDAHVERRVRFEHALGVHTEGWLLIPQAALAGRDDELDTGKDAVVGKESAASKDAARVRFPAALVVFYDAETSIGRKPGRPRRDFALELTRRGFVTLSLGTPAGDAWRPETGPLAVQPLSFYAYVAANAWRALAALEFVDAERIGVVGHSYGGKWALFAAALWERFAAVAVSDPGIVFDESRPNVNYWEPWYLGLEPGEPPRARGVPDATRPRTGAYRRLVDAGRDLHELHALIAPRPFLVSGGSEDPPERWAALSRAAEVAGLFTNEPRVGMTNRERHEPTEASNEAIYTFFERFLGPKHR